MSNPVNCMVRVLSCTVPNADESSVRRDRGMDSLADGGGEPRERGREKWRGVVPVPYKKCMRVLIVFYSRYVTADETTS